MNDWLADPIVYLYLKSFHIIAIVSWMAGLLYLPRLFVYHAQAEAGSDVSNTFKTMERRLYKYIMNPAMMAAWTFGLLMLWANPILLEQPWMHVKLTSVVIVTGFHILCKKHLKRFSADENDKSDKYFRFYNEVPTLLLIVIVIMAVAEPF